MIQIIIAVSILILSTQDDSSEILEQGFKELNQQYESVEKELRRQQHRYTHDRILTSRYHLREGPNKDSTSIIVLNADRIVTVKKTQGNWAYVTVVPYGSEPELSGWVYRYGLKPL